MLKIFNYLAPIFGVGLIVYAISKAEKLQTIFPDNRNTELWQVTSIADADTITVTKDGETRRVRFCGIDAPETAHKSGEISQPMGNAAKEFVESAIAQYNNEVGIEFVEKDRYGRWIGEIWLNIGNEPEVFLNAELVLNGLAWPYKQYWGNCPNKSAIAAAEEMANQSGSGIWLNLENLPPWEWRRLH